MHVAAASGSDERDRTTHPALAHCRAVAIVVALALSGCEQVDKVQDHFRDLTPYEAYETSLEQAGLSGTALANDWAAAGRTAVEGATPVEVPFREEGFISPEEPGAAAFRVSVPRGRRLTATVSLSSEDSVRVFVDLFRVPDSAEDPLRPVLSSDSVPGTFVHEPSRGGDFILRLQPELLRGGQYTVTLEVDPQLAFPVEGYSIRAVQSVWGDVRDGGRRNHEGVDIFARRGTPALAAANGVINRVEVTNLGGKVVWLRDRTRNINIYYAHLDSQAVITGQLVQIGDTVGFIGNTGNARTTPTHLHFGVYRRGEGAVDPYPWVSPAGGTLPALTADASELGSWVRLKNGGIRLREAPGVRGRVIREMDQYTPMRVLAGSGDYFHVRLPDGRSGYVAARLTEPTNLPVAEETASAGQSMLARPEVAAPVMLTLRQATELPVLGRYQGYLYVRAPDGLIGWLGVASQQ